MNFSIEHEQEEDGRWLAGVPELPRVLAYGVDAEESMDTSVSAPFFEGYRVFLRRPASLSKRFLAFRPAT